LTSGPFALPARRSAKHFTKGELHIAQAQDGDGVKVHYTGKLYDGSVFDSSVDRAPLEFQIGQEQVIPGLEKAVVGMEVGQSKTVRVQVDEAYGPHRKELVLIVGREEFPEEIEPKVGEQLRVRQPDGAEFRVRVTDASEDTVTLDGNHPLAGTDLTFDLQLVEIG
jgi:FKBP-type peptidyl-prolyl cis-trans isomerase 2